MTQPHVLVVDDERFFRESIRDALGSLPVRCVLSDSGEEALKLVEDPAISAVVLDVRLPGLSGLDVLTRLRADHPHLHVIVLSAQTDQDQVLEALRLGATDYLAKPIHEEELRLAVGRAVDGTALARRFDSLSSRIAHLANCEASLEALGFELQVLAKPTVQALSELLGASRTSLVVGAEGGDALRIVASVGSELPPEELADTRTAESVAGLALGADDVLRIDDVDRDPRCQGRVRYGHYAGRAALLAPVTVDGRPYGVLCAADRVAGGAFDEAETALIRLLAAHLGARLSGSGLAPNEASDSGYARQFPGDPEEAQRVELALAVGAAITDEVEPEALMTRALDTIGDSLDALTSIYLIDPATGALKLEAQHERGARSDRAELEIGAGLTSLVLQTGRLVAAEAPESDPRFVAEIDTPTDAMPGPLLCLPLSVRGKTLGVARIFPELGEVASARTGELLAVSLSAAIRTVLLYRNLLEAIDDVARARRASTQ